MLLYMRAAARDNTGANGDGMTTDPSRSTSHPRGEAERLATLRRYQVLDSRAEQAFDDLARLAAQLLETPIALVTLLDEHRQWFKAHHGTSLTGGPREHAFCTHTIQQPRVMVVEDAIADPRFRRNPLVLGAPWIRFYAGAPLLAPTGDRLGALCVIDRSPRRLTPEQTALLEQLARHVVHLLELRRISIELARASEAERALRGLLPMCAHCHRIRDDQGYWNRLEAYLAEHAGAEFTHGICPPCEHLMLSDARPV
jgi:GAF domain-containing protein